MDIGNLRKDYQADELRRAGLAPDPFAQFALWFSQALGFPGIAEANAMSLATADRSGRVFNRTVLLKAWDERGFVFFTNYGSDKSRQISENPRAALLFPWVPMERQVIITGITGRTAPAENEAYFQSRPAASRLGAWASPQSQVVESREVLERLLESAGTRFSDGNIPLPENWGGFRVVPETVEFWQGRTNRLHDRFRYTRSGQGWQIDRLAP